MSMDDVFKDVTFESMKIDASGQGVAPEGQAAGAPQPANQGQPAGAPQPAQDPSKAPAKPDAAKAEPDKQEPGKDKPLPYDQDPKWKKARAAEAKLQALMEKHGVLDPDELDTAMSRAKELKGKIGDRNLDELLQSDELARQVKADRARAEAEKARTEGSPDDYINKLEKENQQLRDGIKTDRETRKEREESQRILQEYSTTADKLIDMVTEESPVSQDERGFIKLLLGIDNPINQLDLMDKPALQKEMRSNIDRFGKFVQTVKAKAVEDYVAGKKMVVPDGAAGPAQGSGNIQPARTPTDATLSNDQVFAQGNKELIELLMQSAKGIV